MKGPSRPKSKPPQRATFDGSPWFVRLPVGGAKLVQSECTLCRLPIGAAHERRGTELIELSHLIVQHPRGLLRWFLQERDRRVA
jgi:hypothetical protein